MQSLKGKATSWLAILSTLRRCHDSYYHDCVENEWSTLVNHYPNGAAAWELALAKSVRRLGGDPSFKPAVMRERGVLDNLDDEGSETSALECLADMSSLTGLATIGVGDEGGIDLLLRDAVDETCGNGDAHALL